MADFEWQQEAGERWACTFEGHAVAVYPTPNRERGWTLEIDGVPDLGLTGCSPRAGGGFSVWRQVMEKKTRHAVWGVIEIGRTARCS